MKFEVIEYEWKRHMPLPHCFLNGNISPSTSSLALFWQAGVKVGCQRTSFYHGDEDHRTELPTHPSSPPTSWPLSERNEHVPHLRQCVLWSLCHSNEACSQPGGLYPRHDSFLGYVSGAFWYRVVTLWVSVLLLSDQKEVLETEAREAQREAEDQAPAC